MAIIQPLDLQSILIDSFAGSWTMFILLSLLFIVIVGASFRMPNVVLGAMVMVFLVLLTGLEETVGSIAYGILIFAGFIVVIAFVRKLIDKYIG